jgi:hypothetical protein
MERGLMPVVPIIPTNWKVLSWYKPEDFTHPEKLDFGVLSGLNRLATLLGVKAIILDDFRVISKNPDSQHLLGRAIDFAYPTVPPMRVMDTIRDMKHFSGYGMYVNERGVVSFHVDSRTDRSPESPATWGAERDRGTDQKVWAYTSLRSIIAKYFPAALPALVWLVIMGVGIYYFAKHS